MVVKDTFEGKQGAREARPATMLTMQYVRRVSWSNGQQFRRIVERQPASRSVSRSGDGMVISGPGDPRAWSAEERAAAAARDRPTFGYGPVGRARSAENESSSSRSTWSSSAKPDSG